MYQSCYYDLGLDNKKWWDFLGRKVKNVILENDLDVNQVVEKMQLLETMGRHTLFYSII